MSQQEFQASTGEEDDSGAQLQSGPTSLVWEQAGVSLEESHSAATRLKLANHGESERNRVWFQGSTRLLRPGLVQSFAEIYDPQIGRSGNWAHALYWGCATSPGL